MTESDDDALLRKFGSRVRHFRKREMLSQEALAELCDLDRTYIGGIERGERNVGLVNINRITQALNITLSEIFSDD